MEIRWINRQLVSVRLRLDEDYHDDPGGVWDSVELIFTREQLATIIRTLREAQTDGGTR